MKYKLLWSQLIKGACLSILLVLTACQQKQAQQQPEPETAASAEAEDRLVINNATLEEVDDQGNTLWKIKADKTRYKEDQKIAELENLAGNLYQDGKIVLQVKARKGEVQEEGQTIILKEEISATDPRNGMVIRCDELEWYPKQDLLVVRKNLTGSVPKKLEATATEGRYNTKTQLLDLTGKIAATLTEPPVQLKTEHLVWNIPQEKLLADKKIYLDRYEGKTVTGRVEADKSQVDLKTNLVVLEKNVILKSVKPPVNLVSDSIIWNPKAETVQANKPVQITHTAAQITLTANQGKVDLGKEIALLSQGVKGINNRNKARLDAQQLTWQMATQRVEASGDVVFRQSDPPAYSSGEKAVGKINEESIVVSGGSTGKRVVTEIIP